MALIEPSYYALMGLNLQAAHGIITRLGNPQIFELCEFAS